MTIPRWLSLVAALCVAVPTGAQVRVDTARRVVLITGSTDGLGREVALRLGATGAHIIVHGRNRERGLAVVDEIKRAGMGTAAFFAADFASLAAVRAFADTILRRYQRLDVLINNAGVWLPNDPRQTSADGYELTFAVNYVSGYLLTRLLLPRIVASAPSRIINVSSMAQAPIDFDDVMQERTFSGGRAYSTSKLAQIMFTFDLAKELAGKNVIVAALHPASQMDTRLVRATGRTPRTTVDEGATAVMNVVTGAAIANGSYYNGLGESRANPQAYNETARETLRRLTQRWTATR